MSTDEADQLTAIEQRRCQATASGNIEILSALFAPGFEYIHTNGSTQSREEYVAAVAALPRRTTLGELVVRIHGDAAILTGNVTVEIVLASGEERSVHALLTRTLYRLDGNWRYIHMQSTGV